MGFFVQTSTLLERADVSYHAASTQIGGVTLPLGSLADAIDYGTSMRLRPDGAVPVLRMGNVQDGGLVLGDLKYLDDGELPPEHRVRPGDVLINRTNSKDLVGKAAVMPQALDGWGYASYLLRIVVDGETTDPAFVAAVLNSPIGRAQIDRLSRQSGGQANINPAEIRSIAVPVPPLKAQRDLLAPLVSSQRGLRDAEQDFEEAPAHLDARLVSALEIHTSAKAPPSRWKVDRGDLAASLRLDASFWHPTRMGAADALRKSGTAVARLGDVVRLEKSKGVALDGASAVDLGRIMSGVGLLRSGDPEVPAFSDGYEFAAGDVLYGRLRPALCKAWRATLSGVCSTELRVLRVADDGLLPQFLALFLSSKTFANQTSFVVAGNTHPRIADDDLLACLVPVPRPAVQRKLIRDLFEGVAVARHTAVRSERERYTDQLAEFADRCARGTLLP